MTLNLLHYVYLQILDLLTTVAFLIHGVQEGNPFVRMAMEQAPNPLLGLVGMKLLAILPGMVCWWTGRARLLSRVNLFFALVIAWNLCAIIAAAVAKG